MDDGGVSATDHESTSLGVPSSISPTIVLQEASASESESTTVKTQDVSSVEPLDMTLPSEEPIKMLSEGSPGDTFSSPDLIDKLTALEMLQLLKEYKKREFLYISEITSLQKELYLHSNSSYSRNPFDISPTPFYPITDVCQLALFDPAINLEIRELRLKLFEQATELQKTRDELRAATFSADSVMGRRLINKCKALQEENTDIGKMLLESQLQPLQVQTGVLEKQLAFFKQQLKILHELNADLDEENERLTRQLQELTVLYKTAQQERDAAIAESEKRLAEKQRPVSSVGGGRRSTSYRRSTSRGSNHRRAPKEDARHSKNGNSTRRDGTSRRTRRGSREPSVDRGEKRSSGSGRRVRSETPR